jgi:hypothetical protein
MSKLRRSAGATLVLIVAMSFPVARAQTWAAQHSQVPMVSAPALAIEDNGTADLFEPSWIFEAFYRGSNQHLWALESQATPISHGYSNGVSLNAAADTMVWKGKVVVFYQGLNQHMFIATKAEFQPQQAFNDAVDTGYGTLTSSPTASSVDGKEVDVFFRGGNGHLWQMHFKDLTHWTAPEDLGGVTIQSRPSVIVMRDQSNKDGYQALYVGPNGHLWKSYWPSDLKKRIWWSAPEDLGGEVVTGGPVSMTLPTAKNAPSGRGIETFYLTDSVKGTDRLRFSTWVGYDSKGNTDWWSAPQQIVVAGADFTSDLGTVFFNVLGPEIVYRDGHGNYASLSWQPPAPPAAAPTIKLSAAPDNGYVNQGQTATVTWKVSNCVGPCSVAMSVLGGFGFNQPVLNAANLATAGSFPIVPTQDLKFTFTATGTNGSAQPTSIQVTIAPASASTCNSCTVYYFVVKTSNADLTPACFTQAVAAQSPLVAQQALETANGGYTVTQTNLDGFYSGCD